MAIKNAPPDGYLLMMGHTGTHAINSALYPDLKFDPVKDFQPITALISFNNILIVPAASPAKSAAELVALAKSKPDGLSYGSQGVGTGGHLLGGCSPSTAGTKLVHVPYRGIAPAVTDTVAGRMDMLFASYVSTGGHVESGKLGCWRSPARSAIRAFPDVPTMSEAGFPGGADGAMVRPVGPAGLPAPSPPSSTPSSSRRCEATRSRTRCCRRWCSSFPARRRSLGAIVSATSSGSARGCRESGAKAPD